MLAPPNSIKNYIDHLAVMKGLSNTRVAFNSTSCVINATTWSSEFRLPISSSLTNLLSFGYKVIDMDLGEIF